MERQNKLTIAIMIVAAVGVLAVVWGAFLGGPDLAEGNRTILVLAADESEPRAGLGAVDMAFVVNMKDGSITKYIPVYPGGMTHPTQSEPAEAQAQGAGARLLLHDSLWYENNEQGMQWAKEIVESNTNHTPDAVVAINTEAMDAIISAANLQTDLSAADIVRENDNMYGGSMTRGEAVLSLVKELSQSATNETNRNGMIQVALDQYSKGNIVMIPEGSFVGLMASKGIGTFLN